MGKRTTFKIQRLQFKFGNRADQNRTLLPPGFSALISQDFLSVSVFLFQDFNVFFNSVNQLHDIA
jgi:hypothetical protein